MDLNIAERSRLANILPREGDFKQNRTVARLLDLIKIPQKGDTEYYGVEEMKDEKGVKIGHLRWNPDLTEKTRSFKFEPAALKLIRKTMTRMERESKLTPADVSLYEKFMPADEIEAGEPVGSIEDLPLSLIPAATLTSAKPAEVGETVADAKEG